MLGWHSADVFVTFTVASPTGSHVIYQCLFEVKRHHWWRQIVKIFWVILVFSQMHFLLKYCSWHGKHFLMREKQFHSKGFKNLFKNQKSNISFTSLITCCIFVMILLLHFFYQIDITLQKFGIIQIFLCFWSNYFMFNKAEFIWPKTVLVKYYYN